jgi:hypothetical protein
MKAWIVFELGGIAYRIATMDMYFKRGYFTSATLLTSRGMELDWNHRCLDKHTYFRMDEMQAGEWDVPDKGSVL